MSIQKVALLSVIFTLAHLNTRIAQTLVAHKIPRILSPSYSPFRIPIEYTGDNASSLKDQMTHKVGAISYHETNMVCGPLILPQNLGHIPYPTTRPVWYVDLAFSCKGQLLLKDAHRNGHVVLIVLTVISATPALHQPHKVYAPYTLLRQ